MDPNHRYWHPVVGYNYRMTNIAAAIGLGQVEMIDWHIARRIEIAGWYREELRQVPGVSWQAVRPWARHVYQFFTLLIDPVLNVDRKDVIAHLATRGIDARPMVYPMHVLPPYRDQAAGQAFPIADRVTQWGINLPTSASLTHDEVRYVCECLAERLAVAPGVR
jgi:perosamine synthetase